MAARPSRFAGRCLARARTRTRAAGRHTRRRLSTGVRALAVSSVSWPRICAATLTLERADVGDRGGDLLPREPPLKGGHLAAPVRDRGGHACGAASALPRGVG